MKPVEYSILCDSVSTAAGHMKGKLIRVMKVDGIVDILLTKELVEVDEILQRVMRRERQSAE